MIIINDSDSPTSPRRVQFTYNDDERDKLGGFHYVAESDAQVLALIEHWYDLNHGAHNPTNGTPGHPECPACRRLERRSGYTYAEDREIKTQPFNVAELLKFVREHMEACESRSIVASDYDRGWYAAHLNIKNKIRALLNESQA